MNVEGLQRFAELREQPDGQPERPRDGDGTRADENDDTDEPITGRPW